MCRYFFGKQKWRLAVCDVIERLRAALQVDYVVVGGGNVAHMEELPPNMAAADVTLPERRSLATVFSSLLLGN
jgi:hypothetical protein